MSTKLPQLSHQSGFPALRGDGRFVPTSILQIVGPVSSSRGPAHIMECAPWTYYRAWVPFNVILTSISHVPWVQLLRLGSLDLATHVGQVTFAAQKIETHVEHTYPQSIDFRWQKQLATRSTTFSLDKRRDPRLESSKQNILIKYCPIFWCSLVLQYVPEVMIAACCRTAESWFPYTNESIGIPDLFAEKIAFVVETYCLSKFLDDLRKHNILSELLETSPAASLRHRQTAIEMPAGRKLFATSEPSGFCSLSCKSLEAMMRRRPMISWHTFLCPASSHSVSVSFSNGVS